MKQEINLYKFKIKPEVKVSFAHMKLACVLFGGILMLYTAYSMLNQFLLERELKKEENEETQLKSKLVIVKAKIPSPKIKEDLENEITHLKEIGNANKKVLEIILKLQSEQFSGFSKYLRSLASNTVPGLWLTHFTLSGEREEVSLEGRALRPELVPKLIEVLGKSSPFQGKTFQIFKLSLDPKTQQIHFVLSPEKQS